MSQQHPLHSSDPVRYLGIAVRPHSFAFVVIEDKIAIDTGARTCERSQFHICLGERLARILQTYTPGSIILLVPARGQVDSTVEEIANGLRAVARRHGAQTTSINSTEMQHYFEHKYSARTKYEIAQAVTTILPELAWELPPKRKLWRGEHYRMSIFEAAAGVIARLKS